MDGVAKIVALSCGAKKGLFSGAKMWFWEDWWYWFDVIHLFIAAWLLESPDLFSSFSYNCIFPLKKNSWRWKSIRSNMLLPFRNKNCFSFLQTKKKRLNISGLHSDTWKFDSHSLSWTEIFSVNEETADPSPRAQHVGVWDAGILWIHGGFDGSSCPETERTMLRTCFFFLVCGAFVLDLWCFVPPFFDDI